MQRIGNTAEGKATCRLRLKASNRVEKRHNSNLSPSFLEMARFCRCTSPLYQSSVAMGGNRYFKVQCSYHLLLYDWICYCSVLSPSSICNSVLSSLINLDEFINPCSVSSIKIAVRCKYMS